MVQVHAPVIGHMHQQQQEVCKVHAACGAELAPTLPVHHAHACTTVQRQQIMTVEKLRCFSCDGPVCIAMAWFLLDTT